jgi:hypothetical protein
VIEAGIRDEEGDDGDVDGVPPEIPERPRRLVVVDAGSRRGGIGRVAVGRPPIGDGVAVVGVRRRRLRRRL